MSSQVKKHICPVDKRQFATAAALRQHEQDSHGKGAVPKQKQARPPQQPRRRGRGKGAQVPPMMGIAVPKAVVSAATDTAVLTGTDRIIHVGQVSKFRHGQYLANVLITPEIFERLKIVAEAFQRIQYLSLVFEVVPYVNAMASGGYVAAIVKDPTDLGPVTAVAESGLSWLSAQEGAVSTKIWQAATLTARFTDLYYTSDSVEIRQSSPGRLVVMVDGTATQDGSITIYAKWKVRLSHAALEPPRRLTEKITVAQNLWVQKDHRGLFKVSGSGANTKYDGTIKGMLSPEATVGEQYELPYPMVVVDENEHPHYANYLVVESNDDLVFAFDAPTEAWNDNCGNTGLLLRKGLLLSKVAAPVEVFQREPSVHCQRAPLESCRSSPRSLEEPSLTEVAQLLRGLTSLLRPLEASRAKSPPLKERSHSAGPSS